MSERMSDDRYRELVSSRIVLAAEWERPENASRLELLDAFAAERAFAQRIEEAARALNGATSDVGVTVTGGAATLILQSDVQRIRAARAALRTALDEGSRDA